MMVSISNRLKNLGKGYNNSAKHRSETRRKGFTLMELLVVISIIALLLAILLPSLTRARVLAKQVVCSSNLHQMSLAAHTYSNSFEDRLPMAIFLGVMPPPPVGSAQGFPWGLLGQYSTEFTWQDWDRLGQFVLLKNYFGNSRGVTSCPIRYFFNSYFANMSTNNDGGSIWGVIIAGSPLGGWNAIYPAAKFSSIRNPAGLVINGDQGFLDARGEHWDHWGCYFYAFDWYHNPLHGRNMVYLMADGHARPYDMLKLERSLADRGLWRTSLWPEEGLRFSIDGKDIYRYP